MSVLVPSVIEHATRCRAELWRVIDGDTYVLLVDLKQTKFENGAVTMHVRLRDFSCPERYTAEGKAAKTAVIAEFEGAEIDVELLGKDSIGRTVAWVWVGGEALGPKLVAAGHARPGAFKG